MPRVCHHQNCLLQRKQTVAARCVKAKAMNDVPPIALAVVLMFPVDLAVSLWGAVLTASGRAPVWR